MQYDLHGFDISDNSFIATNRLPDNVKLHVVDAKGSPPAAFQGFFDVVHVRLVQAVIQDNDPQWIISHCLKLLRPGGYLQWEEFDPMAVTVNAHDGQAPALNALKKMLQERVPNGYVRLVNEAEHH